MTDASTKEVGSAPGGDESSTSDQAKQEAAATKEETRAQASEAAGTAKAEASKTAEEAKSQARNVLEEARQVAVQRADEQTANVADFLRNLNQQAEALLDGRTDEAGPLGDYTRQLAGTADRYADRVEELGFQGVVQETTKFARRRPAAFLLAAAGAGLVVGRLGRGMKDVQQGSGHQSSGNQSSGNQSSGNQGAGNQGSGSGDATAELPATTTPATPGTTPAAPGGLDAASGTEVQR